MYQRFLTILFFIGVALLPAFAQTVTNTLLNVNYENGTTHSGIVGVTATHATATDAAFMVQPGAGSNWAIAHKIAYGDSAYYSDGNWRSEADAIAYLPARFQPGDERRYEFSILLKDWTPWVSGGIHETNVFQLKVSGNSESDSGVPLQLRVARNALRLRYVNSSKVYNFLADVRPYYNQWIHFRIDAKWTLDATGYIKTYMKLPGQSDFTMVDDSTNYNTFAGDPGIGNIGYIKWGLYGLQEGLTHTIYHDDIRIFELNNNSAPIALWNNPITDNNPAYQAGPYSPANDVVAANLVNNSTSPSSDFSRTTLTPAGGATLSGRYLLGGWVNGTVATPSPFDNTEYYEFKVAPEAGYQLNFSNMTFYWRTGGATHPNTYVLRSSLDNFATNISARLP
ncbi:heparin lyase I family protein [Niabella hibiscisoli]|uniref:heparin lyase I family protein n=1 Tax=Niabella hibiscisoli TaxID=1825928 RepID=UPI001F0D23B1|nr:heparin lyase I family protein [Niabella hibiscisoli]MCH5719309.1 polysaccharide lyase [Niabella hibiscisoli]